MVEHSESRPGQFAAAIKRAQVASGVVPPPGEAVTIDHGHHEQPEVTDHVAPELLGRPAEDLMRPVETGDA